MWNLVHAAWSLIEPESVFKAAVVKGLVIFKGNENGREAETYFSFFSVTLFGLDGVMPKIFQLELLFVMTKGQFLVCVRVRACTCGASYTAGQGASC